MTLEDPRWLWLMAAAVPLGLVGWWAFVTMARVRLATAVALRAALLAAAALLLAGAATERRVDRVAVIAVVDLSESARRYADLGVDAAGARLDPARFAAEYLRRAAAGRSGRDGLGVVVFDGAAGVAALPGGADPLGRTLASPGVEGTAIAAAIERAAAIVPPDATGRIVLFSDGNQTAGDAVEAARRVARRPGGGSLPIDVVPMGYELADEVVVESLVAPGTSAADSTVRLRVTFSSTTGATGTLRLTREGEAVDLDPAPGSTGRRVTLPPGRHVELIEAPIGDERVHRFEAVFEPDRRGAGYTGDTQLANNRAEAFTLSPGAGRVLFVDGAGTGTDSGPTATLARALRAAGLSVSTVPPGAMPEGILGLQTYDAVILSSVPADEVPPERQAALDGYVRQLGGGLVLLGGPGAFGAGGWKGSELEPIFPVALDLPERLIVPEAAIVLVLDNSGSMGGTVLGSSKTQQQIANEAAARAILTLDRTDLLGVIAFNSTPSIVRDLGRNTDPLATAEAVRAISSDGGTDLGPALRLAGERLDGVDAKVKHILALTDGQSADPQTLPPLAMELALRGITVSTIAVGDSADVQNLSEIARAGRGAFYNVVNPSVLPNVFLKAIRIVRSPLIRQSPFRPVVLPTGSPLTAGLAQPPALNGLVLTSARTEPGIVNAMTTPAGEPLLAHWRVGLGQVAAFTSDAHDWAEPWLSWDGYTPFWAGVVRGVARPQDAGSAELDVRNDGRDLSLRFEAYDPASGRPADLLAVPVTVYGPGGERRTVPLRQTAPGVYEGRAKAGRTGPYIAVATPTLAGTPLGPTLGGTTVAVGAELRRLESDPALLAEIARVSGGRVLDPADPDRADLFSREGVEPRMARTPLTVPLLIGLLAIYLLDIATRRIAWDRFIEPGSLRPAPALAGAPGGLTAARTARARVRSVTPSGATLTEADAARAIAEQQRRRLRAEQSRLKALRQGAAPPKDPIGPPDRPPNRPPNPPAGPGADPPDEPKAQGLHAAKQRARRRLETDPDGPGGSA